MQVHDVSVLKSVDLFAGVDSETLRRLFDAGRVVDFEPGDNVVRQGDFGDTFFVMLAGRVVVHVVGNDGRPREIAELRRGQYFGELAMLSPGERSASVRCVTATELLELRKPGFDQALRKNKEVRSRIERVYTKRVLETFLSQSRYFRDLPRDTLDQLVELSTATSYSKGDAIAREGDPALKLYIVRSGFVRISRRVGMRGRGGGHANANGSGSGSGAALEREMGEEILAYLGSEDFFGDQEVTSGTSYGASAVAVEPVECILVPRTAVWQLYLKHPHVFDEFRRYMLTRTKQQLDAQSSPTSVGFVRDMLEAGLGQARSALIINMDACVRCGNCVQACDDLHGYSRIARRGKRMTRRVEQDKQGKHENIYFPTSCLQCAAPECMIGCPTGAISRDPGGEVFIRDTCIGCGNCARNCDFGNISMAKEKDEKAPSLLDLVRGQKAAERGPIERDATQVGVLKSDLIAVKCDVCFEREFAACVYNCPVNAVLRIDPRQYFEELAKIAPKLANIQGATGSKTTTHRPNRWIDPALQGVSVVASVVVGYAVWIETRPTSWTSYGWYAGIMGAVMMVLLGLMGVRKRLRTQKLGSLAHWARAHAVLGGLFYGVVLFHAGYKATSVLAAVLLLMITLVTVIGVGGQIAAEIIPRLLARTEDEALLPEDVARRVSALLDANEEFLTVLDRGARDRVAAQADRLAQSGLTYVRIGASPKQFAALFESRSKKLPPLAENEHALSIRIAENIAIARLHTVRRTLEILMTSWLPIHLVASAVAMTLLVGHLMTVVLW